MVVSGTNPYISVLGGLNCVLVVGGVTTYFSLSDCREGRR